MGVIVDDYQGSPPEKEFLHAHSQKSIKQLHETEEAGCFIVLASVVSVLNENSWWYASCTFHRAVAMDGDKYYCLSCDMHVQDASTRYKLKVEVYDGDDTAAFILFDADAELLVGRNCAELLSATKATLHDEPPADFSQLVGMKLLFKVEKSTDYAFKFDDSYRVKRICTDACIIELFKKEKNISPPETVRYQQCPHNV
ncbi:hypothetical protein SESBI_18255 [Sesbania bispinosa]|nr:hypothetical protein SESBI_18255 [Sesbania bispinosa]